MFGQFSDLIVLTSNRIFLQRFSRMNGTFEMIFSGEEVTAATGDLVQSLELNPISLESFPGG